jgi:uncharacterized membrane protein
MILAGSLFALVGAASIAVDLGSVFLARRQLQGIADAAALAAVANIDSGSEASARAVIDHSEAEAVTIASLTAGRYHRDSSVALSERFIANPASPNAARVVVREQVPLFFGRILTGKPAMTIEAQAIAARTDMAAFSLATRLAEVSGGLPNRILSALAGTELGLTAVDSRGLAAADVDILGFADALRLRVQHPDATYAELFAMRVPLEQVIGAMADASAGSGASATLAAIESRLGGAPDIRLSDLIDLGPIGENDYDDGTTGIRVDLLSLLRSSLELSHGDSYGIDLDVSALGLASTSLKLIGGQGEVHSPWMTVTAAKDVVIHSSQARLYLETRMGTGPLGLVDIRLPIYIELARAEARLTAIGCGGGDADGVTLAVTPAIGTLAIADVDDRAMLDLTTPAAPRPATLARTPLVQIHGFADVALGGTAAQSAHFTREDIAARRVRTVTTNDLTRGIASSLVKDADIQTSLLGSPLLGRVLSLGPLVSTVGSQLALVAPPLDALINELTATLGVRLGSADVRVDKMRCGVPTLVA